jgi:hypothetical protein
VHKCTLHYYRAFIGDNYKKYLCPRFQWAKANC